MNIKFKLAAKMKRINFLRMKVTEDYFLFLSYKVVLKGVIIPFTFSLWSIYLGKFTVPIKKFHGVI